MLSQVFLFLQNRTRPWLELRRISSISLNIYQKTRMPSNLRLTTLKSTHLVTHAYLRSRDKDGGNTILSAISKNPMLHANFIALCFLEGELLTSEVCGNMGSRPFLFLWPWPWPGNIHIRTYPLFRGGRPTHDVQIRTSYVKVFESYRLTDRQTYIHPYRETWPKLYTTPLRGWSKNNLQFAATVLLLIQLLMIDSMQCAHYKSEYCRHSSINASSDWKKTNVVAYSIKLFAHLEVHSLQLFTSTVSKLVRWVKLI